MMAADVSLVDALAEALPKDVQLRVYHVSTRPAPVAALYSAPQDQSEQKTYCESHLLSIALPQVDRPHELLVFAIEILIFTTKSLTTIFVSKADSTGYLDTLQLDRNAGSVIRTITVTFLRFLINARTTGPRLVLSLFARSQNQYLFPGSVEYAGKHVLDDRQLIRWWCKTIDPLIRDSALHTNFSRSDTAGYVLVPGCDRNETKAFFPASAEADRSQGSTWTASYPVGLLAPDVSAPLRCLIPRLPDDPKSRFLTDLDDSKDEKGHWRSIKTMEQFWDMMSYRQECSAGRLVGFVWVVFSRQGLIRNDRGNNILTERKVQQTKVNQDVLPTPDQSQANTNSGIIVQGIEADNTEKCALASSPPLSSPVSCAQKPSILDARDPNAEAAAQYYDDSKTLLIDWPKKTRGEIIMDTEQYDTLIDHLLQLDFSNRADGEKGTSSFIAKAAELAGSFWGKLVTGQRASLESTGSASMPSGNGVNILTGVRKKRKVDLVEEQSSNPVREVNTLSAGLVRKKAKS